MTEGRAQELRWESDVVLSDGGVVRLRQMQPADAAGLRSFHARLAADTVRLRFFAPHPQLSDAEVAHFSTVDHIAREAFVAVLREDIIAVGRYDGISGTSAEIAFIVADAHQGRGIGTLLLEYLVAAGRRHGITRFRAEVLQDNHAMQRVFDTAGFSLEHREASGTVRRIVLDLAGTATEDDRRDQREWVAASRSVKRLLQPASVVVVGVGRSPDNPGHRILANLVSGAFTGRLHAVGRSSETVAGLTLHRSVRDLPGPVDLAIVAVPAAAVPAVVDDCAARGVGGLVIVSSGFAEMGAEGRSLERDVIDRAHRSGMRVIGPNCLGVVSTDPAIRLNATFADTPVLAGGIGFASQSGALGIAMMARAAATGIGISGFVSLGNKADISGNDLLRYWSDDPRTRVILLYLESLGNPRSFGKIAAVVGRTTPIVAVKSGRSIAGSRAAGSHTAAMATPDTAVDALFARAGVIRVGGLEELLEVGQFLATQPLPQGPRVGIIGNAGGAGILAADACSAAGLEVPPLPEGVQERIRGGAPMAGTSNPVDLGAGAGVPAFGTVLTEVLASGAVDAVIAIYARIPGAGVERVLEVITERAGAHAVPVLAVLLGVDAPSRDSDREPVVPCFVYPERAARTLGAVAGYARWRAFPPPVPRRPEGVDIAGARALVSAVLTVLPKGGWLDQPAISALLRAYAIPALHPVLVESAAAAAAAAEATGGPVALKVYGDTVLHKSDVGGVILGLATPQQVRRAYRTLQARVGDAMRGAIVQPMSAPGVETIVGIVSEERFGPLVMFGSGGIAAEVLADRAFARAPLAGTDAGALVGATRGSALLSGYRSLPAADVHALEDLLVRVSFLAADIPEIAELDCNPVMCTPSGAVVVDARVRVHPVPEAIALRRLS